MAPWSGKGTGEHALLRQLLQVFKSGDIMIADRYYASYFLIATLMQMGVDVVTPQHASRGSNFLNGKKFGHGDHLVEWKKPVKPDWMSEEEYSLPRQNSRARNPGHLAQAGISRQNDGFGDHIDRCEGCDCR